jgi:hypothetical protein
MGSLLCRQKFLVFSPPFLTTSLRKSVSECIHDRAAYNTRIILNLWQTFGGTTLSQSTGEFGTDNMVDRCIGCTYSSASTSTNSFFGRAKQKLAHILKRFTNMWLRGNF